MCGIAGVLAYGEGAPPADVAELLRIREHMASRGPDGAGVWMSSDGRLGLVHRRLAIIDLSDSGGQPMADASGQLRITYNGEIYNYRALRKDLEARGIAFRSESDTEVLLHLYAERGTAMISCLRGMYAFGIWDGRRRGLFLARDPLGIKPLYYADDGRSLRFASQVKALAAGGGVCLSPDPAGQAGFFLWGHVPEPFTMYREVRALPAGTTLWADWGGSPTLKRYDSVSEIFAAAEDVPSQLGVGDMRQELRRHLLDSIRHHLVSDVPVGLFLSAGIDSSVIAALATELETDLRTVTLGFQEFRGTVNDEVPIAESSARSLGTAHSTVWVHKSGFKAEMDRFIASMDQPSIDGVNSYFVAKAAADTGLKVALSGLGADEMFGGYSTFNQLPKLAKTAKPLRYLPRIGRGFRLVSAPLLRKLTSPKWAGLFEYGSTLEGAYLLRRGLYMPWELPEVMDSDAAREGWDSLQPMIHLQHTTEKLRSDYLKISAMEMQWYMRNQLLRDVDWASMAHSVEVRVPMVDINLLRAVAPMLAGTNRPTKRDVSMTPTHPLPDSVTERQKSGFSVPVRDWISEQVPGAYERGLRDWARLVAAEWPRPRIGGSVKQSTRRADTNPQRLALLASEVQSTGGIQRYMTLIIEVMRHLQESGDALCTCISLNDTTPVGERLNMGSGTIRFKGAKRNKLLFVWLAQANVRASTTLIVGHLSLAPVAWLLRATGQISSYVVILHGIEAWSRRRFLERESLASADAIVATTQFTAQTCAVVNRVNPSKFSVIPLCIAEKSPGRTANFELKGDFRILSVGRQDRSDSYKGFDLLIEAVEQLAGSRTGVHLHLVGDGDDHARLKALISNRGLGPVVTLWGRLPDNDLEAAYSACDVFALPSKKEGFGIVFLEAMRNGKPCIGGNHGGTPEVIVNGRTGFLVEYGDVTGLRDCLQVLYADPALRRKMGEEGRARVKTYFAFSQFRDAFSSLLLPNSQTRAEVIPAATPSLSGERDGGIRHK